MKALISNNKVVEISATEFEVHSGLSWVDCDGSVEIGDDFDGSSFSSNQPTLQETAATNMQLLRKMRDGLLKDTDHWALSDTATMTQAQTDYRQALRDITDNATSLDDVTWPTKP